MFQRYTKICHGVSCPAVNFANWHPRPHGITVHILSRLFFPRCNRTSEKGSSLFTRVRGAGMPFREVTERRNLRASSRRVDSKEAAVCRRRIGVEADRRLRESVVAFVVGEVHVLGSTYLRARSSANLTRASGKWVISRSRFPGYAGVWVRARNESRVRTRATYP